MLPLTNQSTNEANSQKINEERITNQSTKQPISQLNNQ
jgi:hypothetical protein